MARIPQEEVDRIKTEVVIEDLVRARGVELVKHGAKDLVGRCPFHQDDTPSLIVTPEKNLWHCMGACQKGGDVFAWVMKSEGVSFRHAYELLSSQFYMSAPAGAPVPKKRSDVPKLGSPFTLEMDDDELKIAYIDFCHDVLLRSPEASAYLAKRGLVNHELVTRFRLGFANRTLGLRLPAMNRKEGEALRSRLQSIGILRDTGHEHFNGCVIVPIFDEEGRVAGMYGRKIGDRLTKGLALHLYLRGPHRGVWNFEALCESKEIIFCEALIDAMTFWSAGCRNVTASYGTEGFTGDHLAAFKRYGIERVLIAYDRDDAGDAAAAKLAEKLIAEGIGVSRIQFPRGMDANEYACKVTPAEKSLGVVIRSAEWIGNGKARQVERSNEETIEPAPSLAAPSLAAPPLVAPPSPAPADVPVEMNGDDITLTFGDRRYRVRGLKKNTTYETLKVSVTVTRDGFDDRVLLDTIDLAIAKQRAAFEKQAAVEIGVREEIVHHDVGQVLKTLEMLREREIESALRPKAQPIVLSPEEHAEAMHLLTSPDLMQKSVIALDRCGIVGERTNKLVAFLAAISRKLDDPLAIIIQSSSAAGKTTLMDAVLSLIPAEERVRYSAMTGRALYYISETSLKHKVLAISEEEGAEEASYALKLLQSEGRLVIASTGKDPKDGKLVTQEYHVEGPVMIMLTTTAIEIDEELLNRCIVLTVDETQEQTRAIHALQRERETLDGLLAKRDADRTRRVFQNAQRLLRPLSVVNPYARELTFSCGRTRARRDHMKYLTLIRTIALLHQYQRPRRSVDHGDERIEYIEVTREDIALANELAAEVLGRSLDELPPQTRRLLHLIDEMVEHESRRLHMKRTEYRFSRRLLRERICWSETQLRVHIARLVELEYLLVHRGGRGQSFVYELLYEKSAGDAVPLIGLADPAALDASTTATSRGQTGNFAGHSRAVRGGVAAGSRVDQTSRNASADAASPRSRVKTSLEALLRAERKRGVVRTRGNGRDHAWRPGALRRMFRRRTEA